MVIPETVIHLTRYDPLFFRRKIAFTEEDFASVVKAYIAGSEQAQRTLFRQYIGYAKSICLRHCSSTDDAEEILYEGFLKVFRHLDCYDPGQPFKACLRTIMINKVISHYRKNVKHTIYTVELEDAMYSSFDDGVIEHITAEEILGLVQQIKPIHRSVFLMYVVDGYNHREIADLQEMNDATVRSHYARARARLQQLIRES